MRVELNKRTRLKVRHMMTMSHMKIGAGRMTGRLIVHILAEEEVEAHMTELIAHSLVEEEEVHKMVLIDRNLDEQVQLDRTAVTALVRMKVKVLHRPVQLVVRKTALEHSFEELVASEEHSFAVEELERDVAWVEERSFAAAVVRQRDVALVVRNSVEALEGDRSFAAAVVREREAEELERDVALVEDRSSAVVERESDVAS